MKFIYVLLLSFMLNAPAFAQTITDFNPPLWNFGTGAGTDAAGSGTLAGIPFTMTFSLNSGTKLFTSTVQHTSNSTLGHGGVPGTLLLGGGDAGGINGEGLTITFASPATVTLGLSHVANLAGSPLYDGWQFTTPADEVISLASIHELIGGASIDGMKSIETITIPAQVDANAISYFKWVNVTTINLATLGNAGTTIGLSSMQIASIVPTLPLSSILLLSGLLGLFGMRKMLQK